MNWYMEALRKYATFTGHARRKEFWFFQLFVLLMFFCLDGTRGTNRFGENPKGVGA